MLNSIRIAFEYFGKRNWQELVIEKKLLKQLLEAAESGDINAAQQVLSSGADINWWDEHNANTALKAAAQNGRSEMVDFLISQGAQFMDSSGREFNIAHPLILAAERGHVETVRILLKHGADTEVVDRSGDTPLYHAAFRRRADVAKVLLDHGAKVNPSSNTRMSPLAKAAFDGHEELVGLMLPYTDDIEWRDSEGMSAESWAKKGGRQKIVEIINNSREHRQLITAIEDDQNKVHENVFNF